MPGWNAELLALILFVVVTTALPRDWGLKTAVIILLGYAAVHSASINNLLGSLTGSLTSTVDYVNQSSPSTPAPVKATGGPIAQITGAIGSAVGGQAGSILTSVGSILSSVLGSKAGSSSGNIPEPVPVTGPDVLPPSNDNSGDSGSIWA